MGVIPLTYVETPHILSYQTINLSRTMKLSKEASKLFHEYECAQRDGTIPQYLNPDKLNNTFGTVRRISSELDNIFNQVVYKIIEPHV